jgi:hypothetical protein
MGIATGSVARAGFMIVLGMGLGCVMQVLVLIVQNAVPYSELGVATSAATFFRSIGGSFGAAIFGAIFSNVLVGNLVRHLGKAKLPIGLTTSNITPASLATLSAAARHGVVAAYAESIQTVFVIAAPIGLLAFLGAWLIPHLELRRGVATPHGASGDASSGALSDAGAAELNPDYGALVPSPASRVATAELDYPPVPGDGQ